MKRITSLFIGLLFAGNLLAQEYATATLSAANTLTSVLATKAKITRLTLTATTAAATTFKLYDMTATTSSNVVYGAYYTPTTYSTNYSVTWTNTEANGQSIIFTNTFTGQYTAWSLVSAATNERPRTVEIIVPASSSRSVDVTRFLKFGLVAQASAAGAVEVEYYP